MFLSLCLRAIATTTPLPRTQRDSTSLENLPAGHMPPPEHTAADVPGSAVEEDQKKNPGVQGHF